VVVILGGTICSNIAFIFQYGNTDMMEMVLPVVAKVCLFVRVGTIFVQ